MVMEGGRAPRGAPGEVRPGVLEALGFVGFEALELPVFAALATGDPLLLVGGHGTAKSALCRALAAATGLRFHAYDAGKALFEDVLGFPDPASLSEGQVRYVPTPLSIWDKEFVLVDELSRAAPQMQNKWLEVVRGRRVMGVEVPGLRYVFAAMNPPTYLGAQALDAALLGRFAWIVRMPDAASMDADDLARVIRTVGAEDAPLAPSLRSRSGPSGGPRVDTCARRLRDALPEAAARRGDAAVAYVQAVEGALSPEHALDGRRLGMLYRNVLCAVAAREAGVCRLPEEEAVFAAMLGGLPFTATDDEVDAGMLHCAHEAAWRAAFAGGADRLRTVLAPRRCAAVAARWAEVAPELDEAEHDRVLVRFVDAATSASAAERPRAWADVLRLVAVVVAAPERFPAEVVARLLEWYARFTGLEHGGAEIAEVARATRARLDGPRDVLALRLAVEAAKAMPGAPEGVVDAEMAARAYPAFRARLAAPGRLS